MKQLNINSIVQSQKDFFAKGDTRDIKFRRDNLKKLKRAILKHEGKLYDALMKDLHKSREEAFLTEISLVLAEIDYHCSHLKRWSLPKRVHTPLHLWPSSSKILYQPLGSALIIAPWNYPFQLLFNPLVGAISSGCCAVLKPSPYTPAVSEVMAEIIADTFDPEYITLVQGGREVNSELLNTRVDIIFFTGSPSLGRIVMEAASKNLTPVVLELGGKSPCIVDEMADIEVSAKRIVWGKFTNAGQTCVAPDYLFVHESVKEQLLKSMKKWLEKFYGDNPSESRFMPRIVNEKATQRIVSYLECGRVSYGGKYDISSKYVAPAFMEDFQLTSPVMTDEIFGPVLPVISFKDLQQVIDFVNGRERPLALYYFGSKQRGAKLLERTISGGACINDSVIHVANHLLPFGGVGNSGMGRYHGKRSFLAFSNERGVVSSPAFIDIPFRYPPYKYFDYIYRLLKGKRGQK
jgi:aldehyde dehydrogenase (NAD+)